MLLLIHRLTSLCTYCTLNQHLLGAFHRRNCVKRDNEKKELERGLPPLIPTRIKYLEIFLLKTSNIQEIMPVRSG